MEPIIRYVVGELKTLAHAPVAFLAALLVLGAAVWWAMDWRYQGIIDNLQQDLKSARFQQSHHITDIRISPYRVRSDDDVLNVVSLPMEIILPTEFPEGKTIVIKDKTGKVWPNSRIIVRSENGKIDGLLQFELNTNYSAVDLMWDGQTWSIY